TQVERRVTVIVWRGWYNTRRDERAAPDHGIVYTRGDTLARTVLHEHQSTRVRVDESPRDRQRGSVRALFPIGEVAPASVPRRVSRGSRSRRWYASFLRRRCQDSEDRTGRDALCARARRV